MTALAQHYLSKFTPLWKAQTAFYRANEFIHLGGVASRRFWKGTLPMCTF